MAYVNIAVTAVSAFNRYQAGRTANGQAKLQASADDYQAKIEEQTALETARIIRRAGVRQVGAANAAFAGAGVKVGEGSALEVERQIEVDYEHDAFQAILEGSRRASGLRTQGAFARSQGNIAQAAGLADSMTTLAYGGARAYSRWQTTGNAPGWDLSKTTRGSGD